MTLETFIKTNRLNVSHIERSTGVPRGTLAHAVAGKRRIPKRHRGKIAEFMNKSYGF